MCAKKRENKATKKVKLKKEAPYVDLIGKKFVDGGRGPGAYDCWGLVCEVFRRYGMELPDYRISCLESSRIGAKIDEERPAWVQYPKANPPVPSVVAIRFNSPVANHLGVYVGGGRFLHTAQKMGVNVDRIDHPYWRQRIEGFYLPKECEPND